MVKKIKNKRKEITLPMKYNPAFQKFEPELPTNNKRKSKFEVNWKWLILFIIMGLIVFGIFVVGWWINR